MKVHAGFDDLIERLQPRRVLAFSQHADDLYTSVDYRSGDVLVFGRESDGLPDAVLKHDAVASRLRIPIASGGRSLNLANAVAVVVYEAWRQNGFVFEG